MNRAYKGGKTRPTARKVGLSPVVPTKRNRRNHRCYISKLYKRRNKAERCFQRIATRYDNLDVMFSAFLKFVLSLILLNR